MNITAYLSYIFLTAFTPGPNNIMAMSTSAKYGLRRGFVFCMGVLCGFLIDMSLCAVFTSVLYQYIPAVMPIMKWVSAAYILFLAFTIVYDKPAKNKPSTPLKPDSMLTGMLMQFVNVKVLLYGITALSTFVLPYTQTTSGLFINVLILSVTGFVGTCFWALFGSLFQRFFEKYKKPMNIVMALLLVYCAVMSVL